MAQLVTAKGVPWPIVRGRLTDAEKAEIERLAAILKKPTPSAIARRLHRHPGTVNWYMVTRGLIERRIIYRPHKVGTRPDGSRIHRYTREQDERLLALRRANKTYREIAEVLTAEFGIPRNTHSVQIRATMLASYDGGED